MSFWDKTLDCVDYALGLSAAGVLVTMASYIWPSPSWLWLGSLALLLLLAFVQKELRLRWGQKQKQKKFQIFFLFTLLLMVLVHSFGQPWLYLGFFPMMAAMMFLHPYFSHASVLFALLWMHGTWFFSSYALPALVIGGTWLATLWLFHRAEQKKRVLLEKKINVFERESKAYLERPIGIEEKRLLQVADQLAHQQDRFHNILNMVFELLLPHTCALYVYEPMDKMFIVKSHRTSSEHFTDQRIMANEGIFRLVEKQAKATDIHSDQEKVRGLIYYTQPQPIASVYVQPLLDGQQLLGVLILDYTQKTILTSEQKANLERLMRLMAASLEDAQRLAQFEHLKNEFESFYQTSSALNRAFRLQEVVETLLQMGKSVAPYDWGGVVFYNAQTKKNIIMLDSEKNMHDVVGKTFALDYQKNSVSWVIEQMKPLHYNDFSEKHAHTRLMGGDALLPNQYESVLILPLYVNDEKMGAAIFMSQKNFFFTRTIQNIFEVLCFQASIAMKNAKSVRHLENLATTDGLTQLMNHRTMQETFAAELRRCVRYQRPMSFLLIDLDHFKKINDAYGHPAGDFVLQKVAAFLQKQARDTDWVARYGGEEFALILPDTDAKQAKIMADRMIQAVGEQTWAYEKIAMPVTFSIGVASYPEHGDAQSVLIEHADQALYYAKEHGRNQACVFNKHLQMPAQSVQEEDLIERMEQEVIKQV
jgi:diguanylate cyclase (GGDEF)-like protein